MRLRFVMALTKVFYCILKVMSLTYLKADEVLRQYKEDCQTLCRPDRFR